ncbi:hypothetical protein [Paractinoplanes brasiliensis]|uniref:Uncharacterized protein n=1 Tax=Paractinoplanes brasiliensis TaxID=52695 RepID=A0A4R6JZY2_9ACTN|nr:hypothetical protein [Actinoplanes brasiliensis]TDO42493.1 hypothetical protein C8E87_6265 [Actinoplanes brasiliensis]GID31405.1 hypothetical protein Abr02nite_63880 [Actinoplanes brasiliensis]
MGRRSRAGKPGGPSDQPARGPGNFADRVARALVVVAARRWPEDLADVMRDEWLAELAFAGGWRRKLAFAASLAVSPAVGEPGWRDRASELGRASAVAAGVTLCAALAANVARSTGFFAPVLLVVAAAGLAVAGSRVRASTALMGVAVFAFLFVGNAAPVMPFMGAIDIAPAVVVWAAGLATVTWWSRRLVGNGNRRRALAVAAGGSLLTLELATVAGAAHAASVLGAPAWSAPAWFPLSLLPGDVVAFGPRFADGAAAFGSAQSSGTAFHASDILLANTAVMAGPLLLCTAFTVASVFRRAAVLRTAAVRSPRRIGNTGRIAVGVTAAVAGSVVAPMLSAAPTSPEAALPRMLDNTTAFGFGFVEHPWGLGLTALILAVLAVHATEPLPPIPDT